MVTSAPVLDCGRCRFYVVDGEDTEAAQFDAVARDEGLLHAVEDCVYR